MNTKHSVTVKLTMNILEIVLKKIPFNLGSFSFLLLILFFAYFLTTVWANFESQTN